jgi:hypothetical protein
LFNDLAGFVGNADFFLVILVVELLVDFAQLGVWVVVL